MRLSTLKTKLKVLTGTSIGEVVFDYQKELNVQRAKTYPLVIWMFDSMTFNQDLRTSSLQYEKTFTVTAFVMTLYRNGVDDKITIWDTIEGYFKTYLNLVNTRDTTVQVYNINDIKGEYLPEGQIQADNVIGISYKDIVLKTYCST